MVRLESDGNLMFLGRKDRQIKTRGYRVELDEVEAALVALEEVEEAAVFPVATESEGLLIEAAVILKKEKAATAQALGNQMGAKLPPYAVPRAIHLFETFPRTTSGKINRLKLQEEFSRLANL